MPVEPRKRGISGQKRAIAVAANDAGEVRATDAGRGKPGDEALRKAYGSIVGPGAEVTRDDPHRKGRLVPDSASERKVASTDPEGEGELSAVNSWHSSLKWFLRRHRGIRPAHLQSYLAWWTVLANRPIRSALAFAETVLGVEIWHPLKTAYNT